MLYRIASRLRHEIAFSHLRGEGFIWVAVARSMKRTNTNGSSRRSHSFRNRTRLSSAFSSCLFTSVSPRLVRSGSHLSASSWLPQLHQQKCCKCNVRMDTGLFHQNILHTLPPCNNPIMSTKRENKKGSHAARLGYQGETKFEIAAKNVSDLSLFPFLSLLTPVPLSPCPLSFRSECSSGVCGGVAQSIFVRWLRTSGQGQYVHGRYIL